MKMHADLLGSFGLRALPAHWATITIGDLLAEDRGISVGVMYPGIHDPTGIPLIRAGDLGNDRINSVPSFRISRAKHLEYRRTALEGGELLLSLVGDIGQCAVVPERLAGWNVARAIAVLRFKDPGVASYVRLALLSTALKNLIRAWATTTVQATLNLKEIRQLPLPWPPANERQQIVEILAALDDKIELNLRMNETLEAIARAIFSRDFLERASPLTPTVKVGDVAEMIKGRSYRSEELSETADIALVTLKSFERGGGYRPDGLKGFSGAFKPEQEVRPGEVVVALTDVTQNAEVIGRPALVRRSSQFSRLVASLDTAIVRPRRLVNNYFLYCLFRTPEFADHTYAYCSGTTVLHLSKEAVPSFAFPKPNTENVSRFEKLVTPIFERIFSNELETETLGQLRDTLLNPLVSGQIPIKRPDTVGVTA